MIIENLTETFDRDIEVLAVTDQKMIYAIDKKNEAMNKTELCTYEWGSGKITPLLTLNHTRIYESFETFNQREDYFYAISIMDDYKACMRRINKETYQQEDEFVLTPKGELVSAYILNEQYLFITDEVENRGKIIDEFNVSISQNGPYVNVAYVFDIKEKKIYPITDNRLHGTVQYVKVGTGDDPMIYIMTQNDYSGAYKVQLSRLIASVKERTPLYLDTIAEGNGDIWLAYFDNNDNKLIWREDNLATREEKIWHYDEETDQAKVFCNYKMSDDFEYFYNRTTGDIYAQLDYEPTAGSDPDEPGVDKEVICLSAPEKTFIYNDGCGEFSGECGEQWYITMFYKGDLQGEDWIFKSYVAVHDKSKNECLVFKGKYDVFGDRIIILKNDLSL